jgi:hypothetical protein
MQNDTLDNAIISTFANEGYLSIEKTRGHEVKG